jgi:hypothetical protein
MKRTVIIGTALCLVAAGGGVAAIAADEADTPAWTGLKAGAAVVDATWHVGAGAGQYASTANPADLASEWDPNVQHVKQASSYGVASRLTMRVIVVQDGEGNAPIALVKDDNYLAQDYLTRRVGQILAEHGSKVTYDNIMLSATHNHNSPYYSTPSAGVWVFQDVMDLRAFEYQARKMAEAIVAAEAAMKPARVGGTTIQFPDFQGNIAGQDLDNDGAPAGYPIGVNDHGATVLRFDDVSDPAHPKPIATYVNYAQHGESLEGYDLISADWLGPFERFIDRTTGAPVIFSQGSVGSAEGPYDRYEGHTPVADDHGDKVLKIYAHMGFAQAERGTHLLANAVTAAWEAIGGVQNGIAVQAPMRSDVPALMSTHWVAGPLSHPYPSVTNCRTRNTVNGDPGPPVGVPDCERGGFGEQTDLFQQLKEAGVPLPENYDTTAFGAVEENLRIKLQAVRIGDVLLASCSCEAQSDLIKNLESRTDAAVDNIYDGFDYSNQADVDEAWPGRGVRACHPKNEANLEEGYICPNPDGRRKSDNLPLWVFGPADERDYILVSRAAFDHMYAQVHNDAAGWNDQSYLPYANSEPATLSEIKGNFTKEELGAGPFASCTTNGEDRPLTGYAVSAGLGHTGDYVGYTVSYREYMARDTYRKALTSYGAHTADYMNTNLVSMAAHLMCPSIPLLAQPTDPIAAADEARQVAAATAIGQLSSYYYDTWTMQIPDSVGAGTTLQQPWDVNRFDVTQFRWVGGDNWTDNPTVKVQRLVGAAWQDYADQSGEVQVFLDTPDSDFLTSTPTYRGNAQVWSWRASFEAFDAYPRADVPGGQVPNGTYRFVVEGSAKQGGVVKDYDVESAPFTVTPWQGIKVSDLRRNGSTVSFKVDPIVYPRLPSEQHRAGIAFYGDDGGGTPDHGPICLTCSFRPWASTGQVATAVVEWARGASGQSGRVAATYDPATGRWVATVPSGAGLTVRVPAGGVRDTYGERNGSAATLG